MVDLDKLEKDSRRLRRLQKFSNEARDRIINDPLNDRALLSRSSSSSLDDLRNSAKLRSKLLEHLKVVWTQYSPVKDSQVEHGLRKLREVIIGIYGQHNQDEEFMLFTFDVYKLSYEYYHAKKEHHKLGNLVLAFMVSNVPKRLAAEYAEAYAIFISHIERDMGNCLKFVNKWHSEGKLDDSYRRYVRMSMILNNRTESAGKWFELLKEIPNSSLVYKLLRSSSAFLEMRDRCFATVSRCYNQISMSFLLHYWFHDFLDEAELKTRLKTKVNDHGTEIVEFERTRR
ncbi:hypothetical protein HG536_0D04600 [Torulaspora globosa]|uniref:Uncharacterized protein n=1 Tax=Torulaspora globosa TaxID=48254 RepID=A0A7G3ZHF2_9SACH|nr:uncharacterized protein HG536_0D04600 [Torulaspora globosa]QLL32938.1 hypothetical protein HG536_0D04600 [Torulaspora globosa]